MTSKFTVTAPTRADLAGGTLDLWPLYTFLDGAKTINVALDLCAVAEFVIKPSSEWTVELAVGEHSVAIPRPLSRQELEELPSTFKFPAAIVSEYVRQHEKWPKQSVKIQLKTNVPPGSSLGGSSTLCVALARGLAQVFGDYQTQGWQWELLHWVKDVEAAFLNVPTGTQDYLAALFGGFAAYQFEAGRIRRLDYRLEVLEGLSQRACILFSGEMHQSGLTNWEVYRAAVEKKSSVWNGLKALRDIAESMDRELRVDTIDWVKIGKLFNSEWANRRDMLGVSTPTLDAVFKQLGNANILGAKVCGAAKGGSILVLVDPPQKKNFLEFCVKSRLEVLPARLSRAGVTIG